MQKIQFDNFDQTYLVRLQQHYSIKRVADMYDLGESTVRKWITQGKLKAHKIGGAVRIPKSELVKLVEDWTDYDLC